MLRETGTDDLGGGAAPSGAGGACPQRSRRVVPCNWGAHLDVRATAVPAASRFPRVCSRGAAHFCLVQTSELRCALEVHVQHFHIRTLVRAATPEAVLWSSKSEVESRQPIPQHVRPRVRQPMAESSNMGGQSCLVNLQFLLLARFAVHVLHALIQFWSMGGWVATPSLDPHS